MVAGCSGGYAVDIVITILFKTCFNGLIETLFESRMSTAYPSGQPATIF